MKTIVLYLITALAMASAGTTQAATYVVNSVEFDLPDVNVGLASCDSNAGLAGDQCTLRAAIMQANAGAGADTIVLPLDTTISLTLGGIGGAESGDLDITNPVIITGASLGFPTDFSRLPSIVANNGNRIFDVTADVAVEFRGLQISGGAPGGASGSNGGGLRITASGAQVVVDRVRFAYNVAGNGGAISNAGTLQVDESDFNGNRTFGLGAAIYSPGNTTVRRSSIRSIRDVSSNAEALYAPQGSTLILENTLISGSPSLDEPTPTGGIFADRPAELVVRNSTVINATDVGIEVIADANTTVRLFNSILSGSDDADCRVNVVAGPSPDILIDYNVIQNSDCFAFEGQGNIATDPVLELLTFTSGTFVIASRPLFGSPVIDRGISPTAMGTVPEALCLSEDQRGTSRPLDGDADGEARCDMGAIEATTLTSSTYTVNSFDEDLVDANPGDDICDANLALGGDQCTLRAAVMEANARFGPDRIQFVDDGSERTITLTRPGAAGAQQGDLDINDQLIIRGPMSDGRPLVTVTTNLEQRLFDVFLPFGHSAVLEGLVLSGGQATGAGDNEGGALRVVSNSSVAVREMEFVGNSATTRGGAIAALDGILVVYKSDLHGNSVDSLGAAIYTRALVRIDRSSFWNNVNASMTEREAVRVDSEEAFFMYNSTMSGNTGGLWLVDVPEAYLRQLTIANNDQFGLRAVQGVGGTTVILRSTILADNGLADCSIVAGASLIAEHNLVDDGTCAVGGTNVSGNPLLAPALTRYDGQLTRVRVPLAGSAVFDAVPDGALGCLSVDQLGEARPTDTNSDGIVACEIGAVELSQAAADPKYFEVNVFALDRDDSNPGDTLCDYSSAPGLQCSLRAAVMEANALPGVNSIGLNVANAVSVLTQPPIAGPASAAHGDLDITDSVSIIGVSGNPGVRPSIDALNGDRIFNISAAGDDILIRGLNLSGGNTLGSGGAIRVVNAGMVLVERVAMTANTAALGGGAVSVAGGVVTLDQVDIVNNGTAGDGAAIRNSSDLSVLRSSIRDNLDLQPAGQQEAVAGLGGSITRFFNSTLSGNSGDAIDITDGTLVVENSTIADNSNLGIAFERVTGETLFVRNTLITDNATGGCATTGAGNAVISTNGYNLNQSFGCLIEQGGSNIISSEAGLGPLQVEATRFSAFHPLLVDSPAVDEGHPVIGMLGCLEADQLDQVRPFDGDADGIARCDIGAIEATSFPDDVLFADGFDD